MTQIATFMSEVKFYQLIVSFLFFALFEQIAKLQN
jgi:hypothetical protein